jgi:signal transduction histidine kinase/CheY-like chemotaxis protein
MGAIARLRFVLASAAALLVVGVLMTLHNEQTWQDQKAADARVAARILAQTASGALSFSDTALMQEYVSALRSNPEIEAAGLFDRDGHLLASFTARPDLAPPSAEGRSGVVKGHVVAREPVAEKGQQFGYVVLRMRLEPWARTLGRDSGAALLLLMALLVVAVLGVSQADLSRANQELGRRAEALSTANAALKEQMSEREKAEAALRQSQKMEAIGRLTGGVAHDFNNLLMVASSGLELMDRTDDPARRQMLKEGVRGAIKRGADLTRQLLAFARRNPLKPEVVAPGERVEGMRLLLERSVGEGVRLELELEPDIWPVEIDAGQLEVALLNIAVNARDAMPAGGRLTYVVENLSDVAEAGLSGDYVRISARDTGQGIPPDQLASVFEPFFTTKGVGKGTGLGLSQVYGFCRSSGGDVRIDSEIGVGTTVRLYMPRSPKPLPTKPGEGPAKAARPTSGRVLLVEDDQEVAGVVAGMFETLGWAPVRAPDGPSALAILDTGKPFELMFSDMRMPGGLGGLDLAREAAKRRPGMKVILTTGFSDAAHEAAAEGMRVLSKPYDIAALTAELEAVQAGASRRPGRRRRS